MNIAIIGYGSIGKRHEKNCISLGHHVDVASLHEDKKLRLKKYDLVIVCSKTSSRLKDIKKFRHLSRNFLIEKPVAATYHDALSIKKILASKNVRIGYCLIFNPIVKAVKQIINKKTLGNIYFVQIYAGSYLPNWRKDEDYSKRFSAKKTEGGDVALELIHEINYAQYLFDDKVKNIYSYQDKISGLKITSDDIAHFTITQNRRCLTITLNYFQLFAQRNITLVGQYGTLFADFVNNKIEVFDKSGKRVYNKIFDFAYNQMYIDEVDSMIRFIQGKEKQSQILSINQGIRDLGVVEGKIN